MESSFVSGALSASGLTILIVTLINWLRYKRKDKAAVRKTLSEANAIDAKTMGEGWQQLITGLYKIFDEEKKIFEKMIQAEREECDVKMQKQELHFNKKIFALEQQVNNLKTK